MRRANRIVGVLGISGLALLLPDLARAQGGDPATLVAVDPATGELVPVDLRLVRRAEVRLDPRTGTLTGLGAAPVGPPPLLAFDPATRTLLAVDLVPVRLPGRIEVDPRRGVPSPAGLEAAAASAEPILVGFDPAGGTLAPMGIALARQPGTFALDPRVGILSPPPSGPALVGFDRAAGSFAPVEVSAIRGSGALAVDPATGQVSLDPAAPAREAGALRLLGIADGGELVPAGIEVVYRSGLLTIDPGTGAFAFPGEPPPQAAGAGLNLLGVHSPTGALMRGRVESARQPGAFTVDLLAGRVEQVAAPRPDTDRAAGFVFGGGLDLRQMLNLQDVLAEGGVGGTGASATDIAPGVHGFAEYRWRVFSVGVEAAYSAMDTEIRFPQGLQTGDLTYLEFGGNVKLFLPLEGPVSPYATFAVLRARSEGDFELEGLIEQRTYESKRDGIGAGLDYRLTPLWGLRAEGLYNTTFEDGDAAEHVRWRIAVTYSASAAAR